MRYQKTTRSTAMPTGKSSGGILTNGISIKRSRLSQEQAFVPRTMRFLSALPWRLLQSRPQNRATFPSTAPAERAPATSIAGPAIPAAAESRVELVRLVLETAECTSTRQARVEGVRRSFPPTPEVPGFPRRSLSLPAQLSLRLRLSVFLVSPPRPVPCPVAARARDHPRNQCYEKVSPLSLPCCSAGGRSSATSPPVPLYALASLPTPGRGFRQSAAHPLQTLTVSRLQDASWIRRSE